MKEYIIISKERNRPNPIKTQYSGNLDKDGIIKFFGLHHSDVEWYRISEIALIEEKENGKD